MSIFITFVTGGCVNQFLILTRGLPTSASGTCGGGGIIVGGDQAELDRWGVGTSSSKSEACAFNPAPLAHATAAFMKPPPTVRRSVRRIVIYEASPHWSLLFIY
jgi:hypothetical protein